MANPPNTWVEMAVRHVVGQAEETLVAMHLQSAFDFHRRITDSAGSHLAMIKENTYRTTWQAATLLSNDIQTSRSATEDLARHLAATRASNRSPFENIFFETEELWAQLVDFSTVEPPVLLWHGKGRFEALFRFLAPRFLLAPDHVLDAERTHARWQWICSIKRRVKLMSLNAILKLRHFLENNQTFPQFQELLPHLQAEAQEQRVNLQALEMILRSLPAGREICFTETAWASHPATLSSLLKPLLWRQVLWLLHLQLPGGTTLSSCSRKASCPGSA